MRSLRVFSLNTLYKSGISGVIVALGVLMGCTNSKSFRLSSPSSSSEFSSEALAVISRVSAKQNNGWIDGLQVNADRSALVYGWACAQGYSGSIKVHLYLGGAAGAGGVMVAAAKANLPSEAAISKACGSSGRKHRFEILLDSTQTRKYAKKKIYVHGINPYNNANSAIGNSGKIRIPEVTGGGISLPDPTPTATATPSPGGSDSPDHSNVGYIDGVHSNADGGISVVGWACAKNSSESIKVHLYLGGSANGGGTMISEAMANLPSEAALTGACMANGSNYRFSIPLSKSQVGQYAGQIISVYGINPFGLDNSAIKNSGNLTVPVRLSALALSGKDVVIPENTTVEVDGSVDIGKLTIRGQLVCPSEGNFTLRTTGILIMGQGAVFRCGSSASRFNGSLRIALKGGLSESLHGATPSDRNFMVMNGGTLELAGSLTNAKWLRLNKTAAKGSTEIELSEPVNWSVGDLIAIAPTNYRYDEAEDVRVAGISNGGRTIKLQSPLKYSHWGSLQTFNGRKSWVVDERAEVANLTRNIVIYSDGGEASMDYRGGHVMVMKGAYAYVDAVEFYLMGRMGEMGRYPFHWHRAGTVTGQYIRNSSVHHSFQRCVTVHGTHNAEVSDNVCYDHFGHGYFLEDGDETGNKIVGNLGILSKRPLPGRHLLASDIHATDVDRFPGPATFWISNPNNQVSGNVAAGSQGTGFWNSFNQELYCEPFFCRKPLASDKANVFPLKEATLLFESNVAHSSSVGMTWDGANDGELTNNPNNPNDRSLVVVSYTPPRPPTFRNLGFFKNRQSAMYFRGDTAYFTNTLMADNKIGLFLTSNQIVLDSAIIAKTDNHVTSDYAYNGDFTGVRVYDGPFDIRNIDFISFPSEPISYNGTTIIPTPFTLMGGAFRFINATQGLQFFPEPYRRIYMSPEASVVYPWADGNNAPGVRDLDGSLAGKANTVIVPDHAFNNDSSCLKMPLAKALRCDYQRGMIFFQSIKDNVSWGNPPFLVTRNDGAKTHESFDVFKDLSYNNKFGMILNKNYEYSVEFQPGWSMPGKNSAGAAFPNSFQVFFLSEVKSQVSPIVSLNGLGQECWVYSSGDNAWQKVNSLEALRSKQGNAYFSSGSTLYLKLIANDFFLGGTISHAFSKGAMIQCN